MKKILLIGIGGVYNYGCEAIVRGLELILHEIWPGSKIVYASRRPLDDNQRLQSCEVEIIPRLMAGKYSFKNVIRKLLSILGSSWSPTMDSPKLLNDCDMVVSIGGDIFTLWPNGNFNRSLAKFGDLAKKRNIPYVLWGCSVGPFGENKNAEAFFKKHLASINLIAARETITTDYLASIGVAKNVVFCADPAFLVGSHIVKEDYQISDKITIGINLSPLSLRYGTNSVDKGMNDQVKILEDILKFLDVEIVLIPHVVSSFAEHDDDRRYLEKIKNTVRDEYSGRVKLIDGDIGFLGVKEKLIECDMVIAARMHCAINAISSCVPTLLIAYSHKAYGMCNYVYECDDWVISIDDIDSVSIIARIKKMLKTKSDLHKFLKTRIKQVRKDAMRPVQELKKLMG
jgi:polysaccharide pyruvyl transferase WcaK-like protein